MSSQTTLAPTRFVVRSFEEHKRSLPRTVLPFVAIIGGLYGFDPNIQKEILWVLGGLVAGLVLFETASWKRELVLSLSIGPLGVQRSSRRNADRPKHSPFLPREGIRDCLMIEHVGAFSVSTHVVFRLHAGRTSTTSQGEEKGTEPQLIPAFPDAVIKFEQCQSLVKQIQQGLKET
jgi:hypothetical protein